MDELLAEDPEALAGEIVELRMQLDKAWRERDSLARRLGVRYEELTKAREEAAYAEARGYARAVAMLRDHSRFERWWTGPSDRDRSYFSRFGRNQLADYLEVVGTEGGAGDVQ